MGKLIFVSDEYIEVLYLEKDVDSLIETLESVSSGTRKTAVQAIVQIGEPALDNVIEARKSSSIVVRREICDILGIMGDKRATKYLNQLLRDTDKDVRMKAAKALIQVADESAVVPLINALDDSNIYAAQALGTIGDPRAIKALEYANKQGLSYASEAITKIKDANPKYDSIDMLKTKKMINAERMENEKKEDINRMAAEKILKDF